MDMLDRLFGQRKMSGGNEAGKATQGGRSRAIPKLVTVLGMLAFVLLLSSVISPSAGHAAFPGTSGKMYWVDNTTGKIQRANLDGTEVEDIVTGTISPYGIALDPAGGKMYWTETTGKIRRSDLSGTEVEDIVIDVVTPLGIALDLTGGQMYWADLGADKIQRANLDGIGVETLVTGLSEPLFIALDLTGGKMYWTDTGADKIQRASLDGTEVETLVTGLPGPNGIALDLASGKMYWAENALGKIQRANLDGTGVEDLVTGVLRPVGIALDLASGKMYWTNNVAGKIQRANLDGTGVEDLVTGLSIPQGIALDLEVFIQVAIDIKPGSDPNSINPKSKGNIPVAILTTGDFDATTVDPLSVEFGPDGATESHGRGHIEDVDGDGDDDLVLHFRTQDTGIQCGDTSASLTGETFSGQMIEGSDSINTVGCK
jgi:sugar lactone lactonase YvrE